MSQSTTKNGQLTIDTLMINTGLTDEQVNQKISETEFPQIADLFDSIDDLREQFGLSAAEKSDVERLQHISTKTSAKKALKYWREQDPYKATFKNLLTILLANKKGGVATDVAYYISNRPQPRETNNQPRLKKWQGCNFMLVLLAIGVVILSTALYSRDQDGLIPVLTMTDVQQYKANDSKWWSPPVYTHHQGYKICFSVRANGFGPGKGAHVAVSVHFMKGEFDDFLKWPFRGTISFRLIDQLHGKYHRERTLPYNDLTDSDVDARVTEGDRAEGGWGEPQFIKYFELKPNYLLDNTLKFQIYKCSIE